MNTAGLHTDQAPPLSIPGAFFALAPLALVAAGGLLAWHGRAGVASHWLPVAMGLTHLGTLGLLGSVMLGALYQMVPVVAGAPVPAVRLAYLVLALWLAGVGCLATGLATGQRGVLAAGSAALVAALLLFLVPVAIALARAPARGPTVAGVRLALVALAAAAAIALWLAWGHVRGAVPAARVELLVAHATLAGVGWLGGLVVAVAWTVVPMFYLTPAPARRTTLGCLAAIAATVVAVPAVLAAGGRPAHLAAAAAPGLLAIWVAAPLALLRLVARRRRKMADASLDFWRAALLLAPFLAVLAVWAALHPDPRPPLLLGWLAIWGWAGLIVHGMLTRIVPFLVWFHRFSALVGLRPVPPMRKLLPDRRARIGLAVHGATMALGAAGLLLRSDVLLRLAGAGLVATGIALAVELGGVQVVARRG